MGPDRQTSIPLHDRVPFLELCEPPLPLGTDLADKLPTTPRLIKTHLPVQFVPKSFWEQRCRVVYVARNAKDNAVSYFHFERMDSGMPEPGDWSTFLLNFMEGKSEFSVVLPQKEENMFSFYLQCKHSVVFCCVFVVVFGSWYDHVNGWWEKKQIYSNFHYMFYEDLIEDCGREIDRLCSFLGLSPSAEEKERVKASATFDNMKQNKMTNYSTFDTMNQTISPFMRKGKVGDWKNHFTVAQNEQFDEDYKQKMKNPDLKFHYEI
ncbi:cytosolic sulfotransferase 3 isoform X3 [Oreochromis niloticus]|nr:cytosolic sulfotransferase 3 isoform X3 [Oreochromis niloticus]XP_025757631.1 cytosolic sulfotransferase 3 isoform X3 [Oreochromis niloticus]